MSKRDRTSRKGAAPPASQTAGATRIARREPGRLGVAIGTAAVIACVLLAQWPALHAGALSFDDSEYLTENPLVRDPGLAHAGQFLGEVLEPSTVHGYYQPLTMISLMADYALGGRPDHLLPFHRTSLLLHLANTLLVVILIRLLFDDAVAAVIAGLLFGLHPMAVETIVWVGERKTLLAAFFAFASVASYVGFARGQLSTASSQPESRAKRRRAALAYMGSVVLFALGLMAKPTVTMLPVCLLLLDFWPLRRLRAAQVDGSSDTRDERSGDIAGVSSRAVVRAVVEKVPFFVVAGISAYITYESQRRTAVALLPGQDASVFLPYVLCHNIVFYIWKIVCPIHVSAYYGYPPMSMSSPAIAAGVIGTALLIPLLIVSLRWTRALATGWLFFFIAIFPTLGVIGFTNVIASDKYAYWPALGFLLILAWAVTRLRAVGSSATPAPRSPNPDSRAPIADPRISTTADKFVIAAALLVATGLGLGTRTTLRHWATSESLFRYMLALDPNAAAPLIYLGLELDRQGRPADALPYHARAAAVAPEFEGSHYNLGNVLQTLGRYDAAIAAYRNAIRVKPGFADAYNNLGNALLAKGDAPAAKSAYQDAIRLAAESPRATPRAANLADPHYNLANVLLGEGDLTGAVDHYRTALQIDANHFAAHKNLAGALWELGRFAPAVEHYETALRLRPGDWAVALRLADFYADGPDAALQRPQRAVELARRAVEITGRAEPAALASLALACDKSGRRDEALATAREALAQARARGNHALARQIEQRWGAAVEK